MSEMEAFLRRMDAKEGNAQGSAAWLYERCGYVTASNFRKIVDKTKAGKPTAEREKYLMEVVIERITGQPQDHFASSAMQWGTDQEKPSRMDYEAQTGRMIEEVGFIKHPTLPMVGGSPDGLIGEDGGWESKSPFNTANHIYTLLKGMPEEHMAQVQGLMWLTGRQYWDFQSYDPRLPDPLCRYVQRVPRNEDYIAVMGMEIITFCAEVAAMTKSLADRIPATQPPAEENAEELADRMNP